MREIKERERENKNSIEIFPNDATRLPPLPPPTTRTKKRRERRE